MSKPLETVTVSANALRAVLIALNGPGHLIRELQATRDRPPLLMGNPIDRLIDEVVNAPKAKGGEQQVEAPMNKWTPTTNLLELRRLGKTVEELGELVAVLGRTVCQGMRGLDPSTMETNIERITKESADVIAQLDCNIDAFKLDRCQIHDRVVSKKAQMAEWEGLFK